MGNCSLKGGTGKGPNCVRIVKDNGGILELEGPTPVQEVLGDFPGYGVFWQGQMSSPVSDSAQLLNGQVYYLLPLVKETRTQVSDTGQDNEWPSRRELLTSRESLEMAPDPFTGSSLEVLPSPGKGVWRVKVVMGSKQLEEVLAEEVTMEALIQKTRMAAANSSAGLVPRRTKSHWGGSWKPPAL
ncbi:uncharacterized protein LOC131157797 [Malania oleifera]|uniref:uncharacterized protein LOC131157797 n=1 Tax=Malania oleifera TaxID=397392 RepID=UPI0025AE65D9|nr:uncharacterized protein LOC131157797 [Malania oleifera]